LMENQTKSRVAESRQQLPDPYYSEHGITLFCGDCQKILPALHQVDLIFTSPPYNLGVTTGGGFAGTPASKFVRNHGHYADDAPLGKARGGGGKWNGGALADGYGVYNDAMPWPEYEAWQRDILTLCWSRLTETGAIFYNHKPRAQSCEVWLPTALNPGLPLRQIIIWARAGGINFAPTHYVPTHEWIMVFAKPGFRLRDKGASGVGDVWYVPQESDMRHPAPFPMALPARAIETTPRGVVLDPFSGIGNTLLAAKAAGRPAIGIEINPAFCEIAVDRLRQEMLPLSAPEDPQPEQMTFSEQVCVPALPGMDQV
jgi:modification methylase